MDMDFLNTERQPQRALGSLLGLSFNRGKSNLSMGMTAFMLICAFTASAQNRPQGGPPGRGGGGRNQDRPILKQFDQDGNGLTARAIVPLLVINTKVMIAIKSNGTETPKTVSAKTSLG